MQSLEQDVQNMYFIYTFLGYLLKAKPEIQLVAPEARNCLFSHENDHLDLYSEYTYSNCRCLFLLFFLHKYKADESGSLHSKLQLSWQKAFFFKQVKNDFQNLQLSLKTNIGPKICLKFLFLSGFNLFSFLRFECFLKKLSKIYNCVPWYMPQSKIKIETRSKDLNCCRKN